MSCALYRHFNADGTLLYIGISINPLMRTRLHSVNSDWRLDIATITVQWFSDKATALEAERAAIAKEKPLHNGAPRGKKPQAKGGTADNSALLSKIYAHIKASGETRTAFGGRVANDYSLISRLEAGVEPRASTVERILAAVSLSEASA